MTRTLAPADTIAKNWINGAWVGQTADGKTVVIP
jgi:hypothetical protein